MKNKYLIISTFLIVLTFGIFSCEGGVVDNPPPFLEIIDGPDQNEVLTVNYVSFSWIGSDNSFEFKYRLLALDEDNFPSEYLDWTTYSTEREVTFENLDESKYKFEVMAKSQGFEEGPKTRIFEINAFQGPSLSFFKSETEILLNQRDSISIWLEDVDSLIAMHVVIAFDNSKLQLRGFSTGEYLTKKGFRLLSVPYLNNNNVLATVNSTGKIEVECAVLPEFSYPNLSISGSGAFFDLDFEGISIGTSKIQYTLIEFHTEDGRVFNANTPKEGTIIVK